MSVIIWKEILKYVDVVYILELIEIKENNSMVDVENVWILFLVV